MDLDSHLEMTYEDNVSGMVMEDSWGADELEVPELYDTDNYDGWDEEYFG